MALNTAPWSAVDVARTQLATMRTTLADALVDAANAKAALADAQRTLTGTDLDPFNQAVTATGNAVTTARANETAARNDLASKLGDWVPLSLSPTDDLARLPADAPIVMLPVRIETRFGTDAGGAPALLLRVYPDEIFLNTHETALTSEEVAAGKKYYIDTDTEHEQPERWRELLRTMTPERAAYVLRVLQPHDAASGSLSITFVDYPPGPPHPGMVFPNVKTRPSQWTRGGEAVLPDRWVVRLTTGNVTRTVVGPRIPEPLAMTPDPSLEPGDLVPVPGTNGQMTIDPKILWTVDYETARGVGMALTIPFVGSEATAGFDKVVVFGVKSSLRADLTSKHLEKLIDAHHYTRGMSAVPQGSATNNTEDAPTSVSHDNDDPDETFQTERNPQPSFADVYDAPLGPDDDGDRLARAFGVPNGAFANLAGTKSTLLGPGAGREQKRAGATIGLLWEVLFGHFGREMLDWSDAQRVQARDWVTTFVRARGPAPAFRIGTVPYGVLPALSIQRWDRRPLAASETTQETPRQELEFTMAGPLRNLRERWKAAAIAQTARLTPNSADPSADLMRALALYPSAREARIRTVTGQLYAFHAVTLLGHDFATVANRVSTIVSGVFQRIGVPQWATKPVASLIFTAAASRFAGALVAPAAEMSETDPLPDPENYLAVLQSADVQSLFGLAGHTIPVTGTNTTLFYRVLVHAMILDLAQAALDLIIKKGIKANLTVDFGRFRFRELVSVKVSGGNSNTPIPTPLELLTQKVPSELVTTGVPADTLFGDYLLGKTSASIVGTTVATFLANLQTLATVPTAELERLFTETMDLASHRLDAWLTAFATRRLALMRARQVNDHAFPTGSYLGGWGYVENLRPAAKTTDAATGLPIQVSSGGLIHAPSVTHAAAAGVLRNGHLTHKEEDGRKCAVDLSSARMRAAQLVLDELRAGQNLGAVLGYRFERRLQDRAQRLIAAGNTAAASAIETYRIGLRNRFPLVVNKAGPATGGVQPDVLAARNVVDGLLLRNDFTGPSPTVKPLQELGTTNGQIVVDELNGLDDLVDGVSDLVTAESILHFVRGNTERAAGTLDALARGARPPESEMVRSVLRGPGLTFPVAVVLTDDDPLGGWPQLGAANVTFRSQLDGALDRWAGQLIGAPNNVVCRVTVEKTDHTNDVRTVKLAQLTYRQIDNAGTVATRALRPLDVVALARASAEANQGSLLDRWITSAAGIQTGERLVTIDYGRVGDNLTFPEAIEVALTIGKLLAGARGLRPEDLVSPGELPERATELAQAAAGGAAALAQAASDAAGFLANAIARLTSPADAAARRLALENASAFVASAYPASTMTDAELTAISDPILAELTRRETELAGTPALTPGALPITIAERALADLRVVFGADTLATLRFTAPGGAELAQSFKAVAAAFAPDERDEPTRFLQGAAEVREGLGRWRRLALYAGALGRSRPRLDVAQLPSVPGERWIGLSFPAGTAPPANGFSPLLYSYGAAAPDPADVWSGLLLDQWTEIVPRANEETGIAFHYDSPGAEAPQAILVVPPSSKGQPCPNDASIDGWQTNDLTATLDETVDLAKIRTVDAQMVDFGQIFPSIYLSENVRRHVPTTSWLGALFTKLALRS
jgi:hypothetical protein